jgi:hypothetical protein
MEDLTAEVAALAYETHQIYDQTFDPDYPIGDHRDKPYEVIHARQIAGTLYNVGLRGPDGYVSVTQTLDKFVGMGIDANAIINLSNL